MILAADVHDRSGRLLLRRGIRIEDKQLKVMQTWGVVEIEIHSDDAPSPAPEMTPEQLPAEFIELAREQVLPRFRHNRTAHVMIRELLTICIEHEAIRLYRDRHGHG